MSLGMVSKVISIWWLMNKEVTYKLITLPETNMAPENNPLEKEIPIGNHQF